MLVLLKMSSKNNKNEKPKQQSSLQNYFAKGKETTSKNTSVQGSSSANNSDRYFGPYICYVITFL
jgi:hypothetical protein